ncbi:MAG: hypothetical protein AAGF32_00065 [Pseudomonadota bacterium]
MAIDATTPSPRRFPDLPSPRRSFDMTTWSLLQLLASAGGLSAAMWALILFTIAR